MLFSFDPRRQAILLLGGDKAGGWNAWYEWAVPLADDPYDEYLRELGEEGLICWGEPSSPNSATLSSPRLVPSSALPVCAPTPLRRFGCTSFVAVR